MNAPLFRQTFDHVTHAHSAAPAGRLSSRLIEQARTFDIPWEDDEGGCRLALAGAAVELRAAPAGGCELTLGAERAEHLQTYRDMLCDWLDGLDCNLHWAATEDGTRPANLSLVTVTGVARLTPSFTRVTIAGADLARLAEGGHHVRLLFGPADADWPTLDARGATHWPGGQKAWHCPVYTLRQITPRPDGSATALIDIFRHEGGRTTAWADQVAPGHELALTGPGGGTGPEPADHVALIGDETALPVIARILEELPATARGSAQLVVPVSEDIQPLTAPPGIEVCWHLRAGGATPLSALETTALTPQSTVFFAAARSEARTARQALTERGLPRAQVQCAGYWSD